MKKLLAILVLVLFWCNVGVADLYNLKIDLNTSEKTTSRVLIKDGYSSKCEMETTESGTNMVLGTNHNGYKNKVDSEIYLIIKGNEKGVINFKYSTKINQDGTIGKGKLISKEFTGSAEFKKEVKPYVAVFRNMGDILFTKESRNPEYGKLLTMNKKSIDGKKFF